MLRATDVVIWSREKETLRFLYDHYAEKVHSAFKKYFRITLCYVQIPLIDGSPELEELLTQCNEIGWDTRLFSHVHYTPKELKQCEFFEIVPPHPTELDGVNLKSFGNIYEEACPGCGVGGKLHGDVLVDRKYPRKYKMGIIQPELYMSGEVKTLVEENGLTGLFFNRKMVDYKGREISDFYVPDFSSVLPPMNESTWLNPQTPRECGHRIIYLDSDIQYEREKLSEAKDFNLTQEYLNNWMMRHVIVSARAKKVLQQNKITCHYIPVLLI